MKPSLVGVCSWSLQVTSVPELVRLMERVGASVAQVALGDPNHATWEEGEAVLGALKSSGINISSTMVGFPDEDYTSPATIRATGGFGNPATRQECLTIFKDAVDRTVTLGVECLLGHAGFIPEPGDPARPSFLDTIREAGQYAESRGVAFHMETGQETAALLRETLEEIACDALKVNFDPANMILYGMGDPIQAIEVLGPHIASVHAKDGNPPREEGTWGEEVPLGQGSVGMREFVEVLRKIGYTGPVVVEREVGDQEQRIRDVKAGIDLLRSMIL